MKLYQIFEYGKIRCLGESSPDDFPNDIFLPASDFNDIWAFVLEQHSMSNDSSFVCKLFTRQGKRIIQTSNYVGVLETKRHTTIEILPKIFRVTSYKESKSIFLQMLSSLPNTPFKTFQNANIEAVSNFPIFEIFIFQYLSLLESLIKLGVKKDYVGLKHESKFIKGQLLFHENLRSNLVDKTKFKVKSHLFIENIPLNRIIHSTLIKLRAVTTNPNSQYLIRVLLRAFQNIPCSTDYNMDFTSLNNLSRLFKSYEPIVNWSKIFLFGKGFTNFSGDNLNKALLYPMQLLFENFIASLFQKFATSHTVHAQHKKYFLIDKHNGEPRFQLRPDLVLSSKHDVETIILDTKWKIIDENKSSSRDNYNIDIADMYQLYAYGKKYSEGSHLEPRLFLIYPLTDSFTKSLHPFVYEEKNGAFHLRLYAMPFDLSKPSSYESQINDIINRIEAI